MAGAEGVLPEFNSPIKTFEDNLLRFNDSLQKLDDSITALRNSLTESIKTARGYLGRRQQGQLDKEAQRLGITGVTPVQAPQPEPATKLGRAVKKFKEPYSLEHNPFAKKRVEERSEQLLNVIRGQGINALFTPKRKRETLGESLTRVRGTVVEKAKGLSWTALKFVVTAPPKAVGKRIIAPAARKSGKWIHKELPSPAKKRVSNLSARVTSSRRWLEELKKKKKKEKDKRRLVTFLLGQVFKGIAATIRQTIKLGKAVVKTGTRTVKNLTRRTGAGNIQTARNVTQNADEVADVARDLEKSLSAGRRGLTRVREGLRWVRQTRVGRGAAALGRGTVKAAKITYRVGRVAGKVTATTIRTGFAAVRSVPQGLVAGLGAMAVVGLSPQAALAGFTVGVALGTAEKLTSTYRQYLSPDGLWKTVDQLSPQQQARFLPADQALQRGLIAEDAVKSHTQLRNVYSLNSRLLRATGTGLQWASFGAIAGLLVPGLSPLAGAAIGFGAGVGARLLIDSFVGRTIANSFTHTPGFLGKLARMTSSGLLTRTVGGNFIGTQIAVLRDRYNWDFGRYFKDNFTFGGDMGPLQLLTVGGNYMGAIGYVQATNAMTRAFFSLQKNPLPESAGIIRGVAGGVGRLMGVRSLGGLARWGVESLKGVGGWMRGGIRSFFSTTGLSIGAGMTLGSIIGFAVGGLLGLGLGPAAMFGATFGAAIGTGVGVAISIAIGNATGGIGFLASTAIITVTTAIGQTIGQFIGGLFDNAVDSLIEGIAGTAMAMINAITALMKLSNLAAGFINANNIFAFMMALMTLASMSSRALEQSGENIGLGTEGRAEIVPYQQLELAHYGVTLIGESQLWEGKQVQSILNVLDELGPQYKQRLGGRKLFLVISNINEYFINEEFVLISISERQLSHPKLINAKLYKEMDVIANLIEGDTVLPTGRVEVLSEL